jgi:ABC-type sulfate transport system permease subunit
VPCSGARRQNKVLDEVSAAILGGVAAENALLSGRQKWHVFATAKKVTLLTVRWSYLFGIFSI